MALELVSEQVTLDFDEPAVGYSDLPREMVPGRTLVSGQRVKVYRNLNRKGSVFSIVDCKSRLVVAYAQQVTLRNAEFIVSEKGRQRVLANRVRNVHAWVVGQFVYADRPRPEDATRVVYYNPYNTELFVDELCKTPIYQSETAHFENGRVFTLGEERRQEMGTDE